jgi:hypothetical protein
LDEFARAKPEELWPSHLPNDFKKKIAIYGGGYTRRLIWDHPLVDDDCEIWSGNHVWNKDGWGADIPRIDRCFDVHEVGLLESYPGHGDQEHFEWLQKEHPFPIYMQNPDDRFPSAILYPFEEICAEFFGKQYRGKELKAAFGSMADFIAAMAIYEGADWIGYFGVEMGSSTEHLYQLPSGHLWLGIAAGRGVTTWVPDDPRCKLVQHLVYAYEGFQMISRQTLEQMLGSYSRQSREWLDSTNTFLGAYRMATGRAEEAEELFNSNGHKITEENVKALKQEQVEVGKQLMQAREKAALARGMMLAIQKCIDWVDLMEPNFELPETVIEIVEPLKEE